MKKELLKLWKKFLNEKYPDYKEWGMPKYNEEGLFHEFMKWLSEN